jgi:hypothetical protein
MTICYYRDSVFGNEVEYVKEEKWRKVISSLTGRKTITVRDRAALEDLGVKFMETLKPLKVK